MDAAALCDLHSQVRRIRAVLVSDIQELVNPYMHDSGYVKGNMKDRPGCIRLCHFGNDDFNDPISYDSMEWDVDVEGFTETGIIENSYGGGLCITDYTALSVEQLLFVHNVAKMYHKALQ